MLRARLRRRILGRDAAMTTEYSGRVAIVYPGDEEARHNATASNNRFASLFSAFAASGIHAEPAVYHDDFCQDVRDQLMKVDAVLVWVNPIEGGCNRAMLEPCSARSRTPVSL
jgi:hypothetical protein